MHRTRFSILCFASFAVIGIAAIGIVATGCGDGSGSAPLTGGPAGDTTSTGRSTNRDEWWTAATKAPNGRERLLAPRELRTLLADGRARQYDADQKWWTERRKWAHERVLALDPDDVEANAAVGRRTVQSLPGWTALWTRMLTAKVYNAAIEELLEQYQPFMDDDRPYFLSSGEVEEVTAQMRKASAHLDRMENDTEYAALQLSLERIPSQLRTFPSIHTRVGPFLVFYAARDLQRIDGEPEDAEDERLRALRLKYETELAEFASVLPELQKDIATLYPELSKRYPIRKDEFFFLWIFGDPELYVEFKSALRLKNPENPYRSGFFNAKDRWGYLFRPRAPEPGEAGEEREPAGDPNEVAVVREIPDPKEQLKESIAYVAAQQLLRHWGKDPKNPFFNRLDRSRAYWIKEGWPCYLASRRVKKTLVGPALVEGWRFGLEAPPLHRIIERESRLEMRRYQEPDPPRDGGDPILNLGVVRYFSDLAWLTVQQMTEGPRRAEFEKYLLAQIEATAPGTSVGFAAAFGIRTDSDWMKLEDMIYAPLDKESR